MTDRKHVLFFSFRLAYNTYRYTYMFLFVCNCSPVKIQISLILSHSRLFQKKRKFPHVPILHITIFFVKKDMGARKQWIAHYYKSFVKKVQHGSQSY